MIKIGNNTKIDSTCILKGDVEIGESCIIDSYSVIENSIIGNNVIIHHSFIMSSKIGDGCKIGPFTHLRDNVIIGSNCRIGNFVEIKNSTLLNNVKCAHHAYLGDCIIGNNVNIGNGVVSANYDGRNKHRCVIKDNCFIGCKSILIAPRVIGNNVYIAAGTVVNKDIENNKFVISRNPLIIKDNKLVKDKR